MDRGGCEELNLRTVLSPVRTEETYYSMTEGIKSRGPKHRPPFAGAQPAQVDNLPPLRSGDKSAPTGR